MTSRRSFLTGCLAACAAPAIVRAASLMQVRSIVPSYLIDDALWTLRESLLSVEPTKVWVPSVGYFGTIKDAMSACHVSKGPIMVLPGHIETVRGNSGWMRR